MRNISILIKPASSLCNIECDYCFYNTIAAEREVASYGIMKLEVLDELVKKVFEFSQGGNCTFAFQGGEPTLAGKVFFIKFIEYLDKYNNKNSKVNLVLQTNGMIINEEWADFLKKHNFLVGLSLDGPAKIHNYNRKDRNNKGTFNRVMKTKKIFDKYKIDYNTLIVVDDNVARNIKEIYEFFKKEKIKFTQYIPCLDPLKSSDPKDKKNLSVKVYANFLKKLFDLWYKDIKKGRYVSVRYFNDLVNIIITGNGTSCDMKGICSIQNIIEADGSVYPCDFYVYEEWKLGNVLTNTFEEMVTSDIANRFINSSVDKSDKCRICQWKNICKGECRRRRENFQNLNDYCEAYEDFFSYAVNRLVEVANMAVSGKIKTK